MENFNKKLLKQWENAGFTDDFIFFAVMHNRSLCKEMIERLLDIKIDKIEYPKLQHTIKTSQRSKGVRLDVYLKGSNKVFNLEMQTANSKSLAKRTRYYQSIIDVDMLDKGCDYNELPELYILFICTDDPFDKGLPVYTFNRQCEENGELKLDDETHIIFYNAKAYMREKNEKIREILEYIDTGKAKADFTERIQAKVDKTKKKDSLRSKYMTLELKYRDKMKQGLERGLKKGLKKGFARGEHSKAIETARSMIADNFPYNTIAKYTGLSLEEIQNL
jgi:predicted transposase/invertase (TIGR01784 family)